MFRNIRFPLGSYLCPLDLCFSVAGQQKPQWMPGVGSMRELNLILGLPTSTSRLTIFPADSMDQMAVRSCHGQLRRLGR